MSETERVAVETNEPGIYEIRIKGHLDDRWTDWFEGLTIRREENGTTLLTGSRIDQAALYGLLRRVRDLGLPLLLVMRVEQGQAEPPAIKAQTTLF